MPIYDYLGNEITSEFFDWSDKKLVFEGDSITANSTIGYPAFVANQLKATAEVIAIAGVPVYGDYPGKNWDFRRRVSHIPADADAIVILGDTNSISSTDEDLISTDINKWTGRWNVTLDAIKKSFPTVPLFLVSCFRQGGKDRNARYVSNAFMRFAQIAGAIYLDLDTDSTMNLNYSSTVWGLSSNDDVHPSHSAMPLYALPVANKIRQFPPFEFTGTDSITIDSTKSVSVGGTANIEYTITGDLSIQWTSSDYDVASVMGGTVYGMTAGTATITATTRNGNTASCTVTVS